jgi:uncharacterized protein (TIGR02246 family)
MSMSVLSTIAAASAAALLIVAAPAVAPAATLPVVATPAAESVTVLHAAAAPVGASDLQQRQAGFLSAMEARDADRVATYFAEDGVVQVAGMPPVRGREGVRRFYGNVFRFLRETSATPETLRRTATGDIAYGYGAVRNVFDGAAGRSEYQGKYLVVWERRDGDWLIAAYSVSSNQSESGRQAMEHRATGTFEVELKPQPADDFADGAAMGRMALVKRFSGDLDGTGRGQMLTGMSGVPGSAAYVAIERVTGTLAARRGSFLLQHSGTMSRGASSLAVTVVPDSGTEELTGLQGTMQIVVEGGVHSYVFEYTLPD